MGRQNAESQLNLPPGFRFYPTDEELVVHYLCRKAASLPLAVPIIAEVDLYKYDPWQLPEMALFGEKEWYFFTPRDRKYPNGSRPNRAAGSGYWKATGADKPIVAKLGGRRVGIKKALVFYVGKAPKGNKTNWIMHEYRLAEVNRPARKKGCLRLDDWVLCRIYNKKSSAEKAKEQKEFSSDEVMDSFHAEIDEKDSEMVPTEITVMNSSIDHSERTSGDSSKCAPSTTCRAGSIHDSRSPDITSKNYNNSNPQFKQNLSTTNVGSTPMDLPELTPLFSSMNNNHSTNYNSTNFVPLLLTDSSCSMPSSPEIKLEKEEVQSRCKFAELMQQHDSSLNQPMFNFGFENLQSPFPQLDQMQAPSNNDYFQDFLASLNPGYIQRSYQMD